MELLGSITELVASVFRKDTKLITLRPNQSTTYTAARDVQLPPQDADGVLMSENSTQTVTHKSIDSSANTITNIVNANVSASAAIARSKLATGSANHVIIDDGSGVLSSEATLAKSRGGSGQDNSSLTFPASGTIPTLGANQSFTGVNTYTNSPLLKAGILVEDPGAGTNTVHLQAPTLGSDIDFILPNSTGTNGYALTTDGLGNTTWTAVATTSNNLYVTKSASYSITNVDNYRVIGVTAGASNRTITLPSAAGNANRLITIKKLDASAGNVILATSGGDTIDGGTAPTIYSKTDAIELMSDGVSNWVINSRTLLRKEYLINTAYTNGTPALSANTGISSITSVERGVLHPYQMHDGSWRMRFNIHFNFTHPGGTIAITEYDISGVVFKNVSNFFQSISGGYPTNIVALRLAQVFPNSGTVYLESTTAAAQALHITSGDVELDSKPTWAD